jgi:hypothetical protein
MASEADFNETCRVGLDELSVGPFFSRRSSRVLIRYSSAIIIRPPPLRADAMNNYAESINCQPV